MNVDLRPARSSDATRVADVLLAARKTFLPFAPLAHTDAEVRNWIRTRLIPGGGVTVATSDETIVAMLATAYREPHAWIDQLYVHPDRVGLGIGTLLMTQAKRALSAPIRLWCFQANTAARRFYERHGFRVVALSDGRDNEERCPAALYEFVEKAKTAETTS